MFANLPDRVSAKVNYMQGAIEKACIMQLKTTGTYKRFRTAFLFMLAASISIVWIASGGSRRVVSRARE